MDTGLFLILAVGTALAVTFVYGHWKSKQDDLPTEVEQNWREYLRKGKEKK